MIVVPGAITEIVGRPSSGRTSVFIACLREITSGGGLAAVVDTDEVFDPASTAGGGRGAWRRRRTLDRAWGEWSGSTREPVRLPLGSVLRRGCACSWRSHAGRAPRRHRDGARRVSPGGGGERDGARGGGEKRDDGSR